MPNARDRGAARAAANPSHPKPPVDTTTAPAMAAAAVCQTKGAWKSDGISRTSPDAELLALLGTLKRQGDFIAALEEEGRLLPEGITDASKDQERRMGKAVVLRAKILDSIAATRAATAGGLRAKAEAVALMVVADAFSDEGETLEEIVQSRYKDGRQRLALSLARDVLAWGVGV